MKLTVKQKEILSLVIEANADGTPLDIDQLIERTSYKPTKAAMCFSIRYLAEKGALEKAGLEKRRGRSRILITPTPLGVDAARGVIPLYSTSYVMSESDAALLSDIEAI